MFNIDTETGKISYEKISFWRNETLDNFLSTCPNAQLIIENKNLSTYKLNPDEKHFFILQFKNNLINQIRVVFIEDVTASEADRKLSHDRILCEQLGEPPYNFDWGNVESVTDSRSGASQIILDYL